MTRFSSFVIGRGEACVTAVAVAIVMGIFLPDPIAGKLAATPH